MSLCDKANCFFGLLFLIQIGLSKSEGEPRAAAPSAARDTGSYLPHRVRWCLQMTLRVPLQPYVRVQIAVLCSTPRGVTINQLLLFNAFR